MSQPGTPTRSAARLVFLSTALGTFIVTANISTMNVAFPDLEGTFVSASRGSLTWVLNSYTIAFAALLIPAGRLADRLGRRGVFRAGLAMFALSSVLVGAAPTLPVVIAARIGQGVGGAMVVPSSLGLLLAATPGSERTTTIAKWGSITALGVATGPSLGAFIVDGLGWRWAFLLLPPFCLVSYLLGRNTLPDTATNPDAPFPDLIGATFLATAMAGAAFAIVQVRPWGATSPGVLVAATAAAVAIGAVLVRSRHHPAPAFPLELFGIRSFRMANLATALQSGTLSASLLINVLWLTEGWGYSIFQAGLATLPSPLLVALLAPIIGRGGARYGIRLFAVPGAFLWGFGQWMYAGFVGVESNWWLHWLPASLVVAVGIAATFPLIAAAAVSEVGQTEFAVAGAINQVGRQLGATIGVAALVTLVGETGELGSFRQAWIAIGAMGPLSAIAVFLIGAGPRSAQTSAAATDQ